MKGNTGVMILGSSYHVLGQISSTEVGSEKQSFFFFKDIYLFGCAGSQLWHGGSLVAT